MKKVLGVALALALAGTSVFAQVSTSLEFKERINIVDLTVLKGDHGTTPRINDRGEFELYTYDYPNTYHFLGQKVLDDTQVSFSVSADHAGVSGTIDFVGGDGKKGVFVDTVTGWFRIGRFKLTGSNDAIRFTYRIEQDRNELSFLRYYHMGVGVDRGSLTLVKQGGVAVNPDKNIGFDADNMVHEDATWSTIADYTFNFDFAELLVRAALFQQDFNQYLKSGFGFEAAFASPNNSLTVDLVAKFPAAYQQIYAAYIHMRPNPMFMVTAGGAFSYDGQPDQTYSVAGNVTYNRDRALLHYGLNPKRYSERRFPENVMGYGLDARVRIESNALALTIHGNFSQQKVTRDDRYSHDQWWNRMYAVANATFTLRNDTFKPFVEAGWTKFDTPYEGAHTNTGWDNGTALAQAGIIIKPVENVTVTTAVKAEIAVDSKDGARTILQIPVVWDIAF